MPEPGLTHLDEDPSGGLLELGRELGDPLQRSVVQVREQRDPSELLDVHREDATRPMRRGSGLKQ